MEDRWITSSALLNSNQFLWTVCKFGFEFKDAVLLASLAGYLFVSFEICSPRNETLNFLAIAGPSVLFNTHSMCEAE